MQISLTAADGHRLGAYRAGPAHASQAVVVIQEIFGVNSHIRSIADRLAKAGYAVIAPALFDRVEPGVELGYGPQDVARGRTLRAQVSAEGSLLDLQAALDALPADAQIGVVGFCWGGTLAWQLACLSERIAASSCWYGGGIADLRDDTPRVPVQMHFGTEDTSIPVADVEAIRQAQPEVAVYEYPQVGHGFGCDQRASYDADAAALAWERTLDFFRRHVGDGATPLR